MPHSESSFHEVASPDRPPQLNFACSCGCGCPCSSGAAASGGGGDSRSDGGPAPSRDEWLVPPNPEQFAPEGDNEQGFADLESELASSGIINTRCGAIHLSRLNEFEHLDYEGDESEDFPGTPSSMFNEEATGGYQSMSSSSILSFRPYSPSVMLQGLTPRNEQLPGFFSQPPLRLTPEMAPVVYEYPAGARWTEHDHPVYPETIESEELGLLD